MKKTSQKSYIIEVVYESELGITTTMRTKAMTHKQAEKAALKFRRSAAKMVRILEANHDGRAYRFMPQM